MFNKILDISLILTFILLAAYVGFMAGQSSSCEMMKGKYSYDFGTCER
jgi:hypothetical protein